MPDAAAPPSAPGVVSLASRFSVDDTVGRLREAVRAKGLTEFALIDQDGAAKGVDLELRPTKLLLFGNPRAGTPLMVAAPLVGIDLPLKALVWQDGEDRVWVSFDDPAYLGDRYGLPPELRPNIAGVGPLIEAALAG